MKLSRQVNRPLVARKITGSILEATCFTTQEPARVAEKRLTRRS